MKLTTRCPRVVVAIAMLSALLTATSLCGCSREEPTQVGDINAPEQSQSSDEVVESLPDTETDEESESSSSTDDTVSDVDEDADQPNGDRGSSPAGRDVGVASAAERETIAKFTDNAKSTWPNTTSLDPATDAPSSNEALNNDVAFHLVDSVSKLTSLSQQGQISGGPLEEIFASDFYSVTTVASNIHNFGHDNLWYLDPADVRVYENGSLDEGIVKVVFTMRDTATNSEQWTFDGYCDTKFWMFKLVGESNPENVVGDNAQ